MMKKVVSSEERVVMQGRDMGYCRFLLFSPMLCSCLSFFENLVIYNHG